MRPYLSFNLHGWPRIKRMLRKPAAWVYILAWVIVLLFLLTPWPRAAV